MKRFIFDSTDKSQQKSKNRFSFPFNGGDNGNVREWIDKVKPYDYFIHDIYFACPNVSNFFSNRMSKEYSDKCIELCNTLEQDNWHPNCTIV